MKKILLFVTMTFLLLFANAQPKPTFWSNWSTGGNVIVTKEFKADWGTVEGTNIGFGLTVHKQLDNHWGFRIVADVSGVFVSNKLKSDRYGKGMIGFDYRFNNGIYLFSDGGGAMMFDNINPLLKLVADLGIGYIYDININNSLFAELGGDVIAMFHDDWRNSNVFFKIGYRYNFGLTTVDKKVLEQWTIIQETGGTTCVENDSIATYHKKHCHDTLITYMQKINILQHNNEALLQEIKLKDSIISELDSILASMRENSDNFYAMPFSIEFDNDSYTVKENQYEKLKQVAYIMNSDTTVNYKIVGYCDYTGSVEYNQKLSEKRANEVKRLLVERCGVKEEQLTVDGKGKDVAFGDIKSPINRRVSFFREF